MLWGPKRMSGSCQIESRKTGGFLNFAFLCECECDCASWMRVRHIVRWRNGMEAKSMKCKNNILWKHQNTLYAFDSFSNFLAYDFCFFTLDHFLRSCQLRSYQADHRSSSMTLKKIASILTVSVNRASLFYMCLPDFLIQHGSTLSIHMHVLRSPRLHVKQ